MAFAPDYATQRPLLRRLHRQGRRRHPRRRDAGPGRRRRPRAPHVLTIPHPTRPEPQRRPAPVRPRRLPLHRHRRRRRRRRPAENAPEPDSLLGKILRIDPQPSGRARTRSRPTIRSPARRRGADEIWAYGLRNPWRFSFDRADRRPRDRRRRPERREEVDFAPRPPAAGAARTTAGTAARACYSRAESGLPAGRAFTDPIFDTPHRGSARCSITGGYVERDPDLVLSTAATSTPTSAAGRLLVCRRPHPPQRAPLRRATHAVARTRSRFGEDSCGTRSTRSSRAATSSASPAPAASPARSSR